MQIGFAVVLLFFVEQVGLMIPFRAFGEATVEPVQALSVSVVRKITVPFELINQRYAQIQTRQTDSAVADFLALRSRDTGRPA